MQAQPTQRSPVNTKELARLFEFDLAGDEHTAKQLQRMIEEAAYFIRAMNAKEKPYWLTFLGTSGAGKTYLARRIWNWFKRSALFEAEMKDGEICYPGSWIAWPEMAAQLLGNKGYGQLEDLHREKLVVLDEIGADRDPSGHVRDCLSRLLSCRVGKWTILTSNKTLDDIQRDIDTRLSSRIIRDGNIVLDVELKDYALRQRENHNLRTPSTP